MRSWIVVIFSLVLLTALPGPAGAARKLALVIGNNNYDHISRLERAVPDAISVGDTLTRIGFEVTLLKNLRLTEMERAIDNFASKVGAGDTALFFYAGHGWSDGRVNFLLPVDTPNDDISLYRFSLSLSTAGVIQGILDKIRGRGARLSVAIIDACRNNPFTRADGTRSGGLPRGLARVDAPRNSFVIFSAREGQAALDKLSNNDSDPNGVFTRVFLPLLQPDRSLIEVVKKTQERVDSLTNQKQSPVYFDGFVGVPCLAVCREEPTPTPPPPLTTAPPPPPLTTPPALSELTTAPYTFSDCTGCPTMVVIPAGSFMMGSPRSEAARSTNEDPQHEVRIERPFAVGKFEVTFDEWRACGGACGFRPPDEGWGQGRMPVINVTWNQAKEYTTWLSRRTGKPYRLLSEAEWEYAARAGTSTRFPAGDRLTARDANFWHASSPGQPTPVGSFPANAFGLHDMIGNVWEWVLDCWNDSYRNAPAEGAAARTGDCRYHVVRGGSFYDDSESLLRLASRYWYYGLARRNFLGFRVARPYD